MGTVRELSVEEKRARLAQLLRDKASQRTYPLSFAQERLWFLEQLEARSPLYNLFTALRLRGPLDVAVLTQVVNALVQRHEALRTVFVRDEAGNATQRILPDVTLSVPSEDLRALPAAERESEAHRRAVQAAQQPFDLAEGPLLRTHLLRLADDEHLALLNMHHIITDGWSVNLFIGELAALYHAFMRGQASPLRPLPLKYADFALWQRQTLQGDHLTRQVTYWKAKLAGAPPLLELPLDSPRPAVQSNRGAAHLFAIPPSLTDALKRLSQQEQVSPFMTLLAAFKVLLYRLSGQTDVVVGSPIANRTRTEVEGVIGFFVNTLVLRSDLAGNPRFRDLLQEVRQTALDAYAHQDLPFEQVVEALQPPRTLAHAPLFQVMFVLQNSPRSSLRVAGLTVQQEEIDRGLAKFDLTLVLQESGQGLSGSVEYNRDLFDPATIRRWCQHFQTLLAGIVANADQPIATLPLLSNAEQDELLTVWNATAAAARDDALLHQCIARRAQRSPEAIAVVYGKQHLSYGALNQRADQLAHCLQALGVGPDTLVALYVERSVDLIVAILAILKAGGAYLPLDPDYPSARLGDMLADAAPPILLTQSALVAGLPAFPGRILCLDSDGGAMVAGARSALTSTVTADNLAYVIYTSGSTGRPKGVMVTHGAVANLRDALHAAVGTRLGSEPLRVSVNGSVSFDTSVKQLIQLAHGHTLDITPQEIRFDGPAMLDYLHQHQIGLLDCTPSQLRVLIAAGLLERRDLPLQAVLVGGEAIDGALWEQLADAAPLAFYNVYGPTECTVDSTVAPITRDTAPTLGRPVANTRLFVLDRYRQAAPVGVVGELYIGGLGLARGYLNQPAATADKFVPDPFSNIAGARLYRTGDAVRYRPDGTLEFLGRQDDQVKIRGFRIELGEIEAVLGQHPAVQEGAVSVVAGASDKRLVAYVVLDAVTRDAPSSIAPYLKERLPTYMVPTTVMVLDALPLTPNGKVDRRALPAPDFTQRESTYVAPRTATESQVAAAWAQVLQVEQFGIHDNFFEVGGHSLLATQLVSQIRVACQCDLPLRTLFEAPTVAGLAAHIAGAARVPNAAPITPRLPSTPVPLAFAQERLWFLDQLEPESPFYNIHAALRLHGMLDVAALQDALNGLIQRHESLRTTFVTGADGQPLQQIAPTSTLTLTVEVLPELSPDTRAGIEQLARTEAQQPFNLSVGPLLRARLVRLAADEHLALLTLHHIITDGWSTNILISELATLYQGCVQGHPDTLPSLPLQYADFALWQREWLQGERLAQQVGYWQAHLAGAPPLLELPTDRPRPAVQTFRGATLPFSIPAPVVGGLHRVSQQEGATLFMTLLAAFKVLLYRYTDQADIVVGSPIANRTRAEVEGLIGFFVNTLVLRSDLSGNPSFRELMQRVRQTALDAYAYQDLPFEQVVEAVQPPRSLSYSPLFQVLFVLQNTPRTALKVAGLMVEPIEADSGIAKFDLTMTLTEGVEGLKGTLEYNSDLFDRTTIERLRDHFQTLLGGIVANPDQPIATLPLLRADERHLLLTQWNATSLAFPRERCLHQWFEAQAAQTPDAVALVCGTESLTYAALDARANQLAHHLQGLGVGPEIFVGVYLRRTAEMVVALLGILKAGGAYAPLDPAYPADRLAFILQNAQVRVVLTEEEILARLPATGAAVICVDRDGAGIARESVTLPSSQVTVRHLAYVIYTSGSTGQPKGVAISHANAGALLAWAATVFTRADLRAVLAATSINFDLSVYELFLPLSVGGKVVLAQNLLELPDLPAAEEVTLVNTVPSVLSEFLKVADLPAAVRTVNLAGEPLPSRLAQQVYARPHVERLYNLYGPSEDTTYSTWALLEPEDFRSPTIGRPIANTQLYLLDAFMQPVPVGVVGQLYLGGDGVARGYLHRPTLTAEKFIPDPFSPLPGARLYATGDLARYRADGNVEFLGRADHQVKVRGFRIELGEIEAVLVRHPAVQDAVVVVREEAPGDKRLVAYIVPDATVRREGPSRLTTYLRGQLPEYMIPSAWVMLDALPLTANGKIDRRALPAPEDGRRAIEDQGHTAPRSDTEAQLAHLWATILRVEQVGIDANFFEIGGHSLLATQVIARARAHFQVELPLRAIFESPTVEALARQIEAAQRAIATPPLVPRPHADGAPLSFAQERLWFLDQLQPHSPFYNLLLPLRLRGPLEIATLSRALNTVVRRHEALRTCFVRGEDGVPRQHILPELTLGLPVTDLSAFPPPAREAEARRLAHLAAQQPFDLATGPLLRAHVVRLAEDDHVALLTLHHIITDGWSLGLMMQEIAALYQAFSQGRPSPLPDLPLQYVDFALWQREWLQGEVLAQQRAYWQRQLAGAPPLLELPTDRPRPAVQTFRGATHPFTLSPTLGDALKRLSQQAGTTPFMTLLAAFKVLLYRLSQQSEVVVGSPIANRTHADLEGLMGFFVNTLVLRTELAGNLPFVDLLQRVRDTALAAYTHQELPFEQVVEAVQPPRNLSHTPLFQVMFALQNTPMNPLPMAGLSVAPVAMESGIAKFDLTVTLTEQPDGLRGTFEYNCDLFDAATIERWSRHFETLLAAVVADPTQPINHLPLLTEGERHRLLTVWNSTAQPLTANQGVHETVAQAAAQTPSALALAWSGGQFTYGALNRRANRLAHYLQSLGVGPEVPVAVCLPRAPELVIGLLAILKAGGAYVPLDPAYPPERLTWMVADSRAPVLITQAALRPLFSGSPAQVICPDWDGATLAAYPDTNPHQPICGDQLAYSIYTSGSTGLPKGTGLTHRGLLNLVAWHQRAFALTAADRATLIAGVGFDACTWELWPYLTVGASLHIPDDEQRTMPARLRDWLVRQGISVTFLPTPLAEQVLLLDWPADTPLRVMLTGGDKLTLFPPPDLPFTLVNNYGPTEDTVVATSVTIPAQSDEGVVPAIGYPIDNTHLYLVDEGLQPVPIGVAGEVVIGGVGVARGYLHRPALTATKFIPDPFSDVAGARLYTTGDLARYRPDGNIEFLGRRDDQVKVRGFRIELGEIEAVLAQHPALQAAVVLARGDTLVAYYVRAEANQDGQSPVTPALQEFLKARLPDYMVPAAWVRLDALPLTPNGKIDRRALPIPDTDTGEDGVYTAPRTATENHLATLWADLLNRERVSVEANFFEIGGHSLLAVQLLARIEQSVGVRLPLATLFHTPTIAGLATQLNRREDEASSLVPLQQGDGSGPPLFLVHPVGGNVFCYVPLVAHMERHQPVYGLQAPGLEGEQGLLPSIEAMAARYVALMQQVQPEGPYRVGGWSLGGVIAFEMARQLREQGRRVGQLLLLDSRVPQQMNVPPPDEAALLATFALEMGLPPDAVTAGLKAMDSSTPTDERLAALLSAARQANLLPADVTLDTVRSLYTVFRHHVMLLADYTPRPYDGTAVLLAATEPLVGDSPTDDCFGWGTLAADGITRYAVAGNHFSMVRPPHIATLAAVLNTLLSEKVGA